MLFAVLLLVVAESFAQNSARPISSLEIRQIGPTTLYLRWSLPRQGSHALTNFDIQMSKIEGDEIQPEVSVLTIPNPNYFQTKIFNVELGSKQRIYFYSIYENAVSKPYTIDYQMQRNWESNPAVPDFLIYIGNNENELRITWLPNLNGNPGNAFFVLYRIKGMSKFQQTNIEYNDFHIIVADIKQGYIYQIIVVACNGQYKTESKMKEVYVKKKM